MEYYVAGRFAGACRHSVSGHLFHHALELLFKAGVIGELSDDRQHDEQERLKRVHRHSLESSWGEFVATVPQPRGLHRFDDLVRKVDAWEEVRYPGFPRGLSNTFLIGMYKVATQARRLAGPPSNVYQLSVEEIDELVTAAVAAMDINPQWVRVSCFRSDVAVEMYLRENRHPMW